MTRSTGYNHVRIIVSKFGNANRMAKVLGVPRTTVYSWIEMGFIPQKYHEIVYIFGQTIDPPVEVGDFLCFDLTLARKRAVDVIDSLNPPQQ